MNPNRTVWGLRVLGDALRILAADLRAVEPYRRQDQLVGFLVGLALCLLFACGSTCGDSFVIASDVQVAGELAVYEDCVVADEQGYDLSDCCPAGYEAVGFDTDGGVVCVGVCP